MRFVVPAAVLAVTFLGATGAQAQQTLPMASRFAIGAVEDRLDEGDDRLALYRRSGEPNASSAAPSHTVFGWMTRNPEHPSSLYMQGSALGGFRDSSGNQSGFRYDEGMAWLGADRRFGDHWVLGTAIGYGAGNAKADMGSLTKTTAAATFYGLYQKGHWFVEANSMWDWDQYDHIARTTVDGIAGATSQGNSWGASALSGWMYAWGPVHLGPVGGLRFSSAHVDGYTEGTAGNAALIVSSQDIHRLMAEGGFELQGTSLSSAHMIAPRLRVTVETAVLNNTSSMNTQDGLGNTAIVDPTKDPSTRGRLRLGLGGSLGRGATLGADVETSYGNGGLDGRVSSDLHFAF